MEDRAKREAFNFDLRPRLTITLLLGVVLVLIPLLLVVLPPPLVRRKPYPLLGCGERKGRES